MRAVEGELEDPAAGPLREQAEEIAEAGPGFEFVQAAACQQRDGRCVDLGGERGVGGEVGDRPIGVAPVTWRPTGPR